MTTKPTLIKRAATKKEREVVITFINDQYRGLAHAVPD